MSTKRTPVSIQKDFVTRISRAVDHCNHFKQIISSTRIGTKNIRVDIRTTGVSTLVVELFIETQSVGIIYTTYDVGRDFFTVTNIILQPFARKKYDLGPRLICLSLCILSHAYPEIQQVQLEPEDANFTDENMEILFSLPPDQLDPYVDSSNLSLMKFYRRLSFKTKIDINIKMVAAVANVLSTCHSKYPVSPSSQSTTTTTTTTPTQTSTSVTIQKPYK